MYVQQQRFAEDYRDALKFPLVVHLAELAGEYGLPYDDEAASHSRQRQETDDSSGAADEDDPE